jgi:hypothetical protein
VGGGGGWVCGFAGFYYNRAKVHSGMISSSSWIRCQPAVGVLTYRVTTLVQGVCIGCGGPGYGRPVGGRFWSVAGVVSPILAPADTVGIPHHDGGCGSRSPPLSLGFPRYDFHLLMQSDLTQ